MSSDLRLREALERLAQLGRERLARHPLGHLASGRRATLELSLKVPLDTRGKAFDDAVAGAREHLEAEIETLLAHRALFQPGHVFCLRCGAADCEHSAPGDPRQIFAGFGPSGLPRFVDFGQWLLERQHPHLDRLYEKPPRLVTEVVSGRELTRELLPAFRDPRTDYRLHGQVVAGWFRLRRGAGHEPLALSFQVVSSRHVAAGKKRRPARRRLGLNLLGAGPGGETLAEVYDQMGTIPWTPVVQWAQSVLDSIERSQGRKSATPEHLSQRIEGMLQGIARRLEQGRRARERRTRHAQERHTSGERPTRMALSDLEAARDEQVLFDIRRRTLVVLGERGRAHVFNAQGKIVTSIRYSAESIERRRQREIWRPATSREIAELRRRVAAVGAKDAAG